MSMKHEMLRKHEIFKKSPDIRKCLGKILFYKSLLLRDINRRIERHKICLQIGNDISEIDNIDALYSWDITAGYVKYSSITVDITELRLYKEYVYIRSLIMRDFFM